MANEFVVHQVVTNDDRWCAETNAKTIAACQARLGLSRKQVADALGLEERYIEALAAGAALFRNECDYGRAVTVLEQAAGLRL